MRIAVITESNDVYLEFTPDKFRQLFKEYFNKTRDIDKSFDLIIEDLRKETNRK